MSVDFFSATCKEPAQTSDLFGICDDQDGTIAYTDIQDTDKWIATVKNKNQVEVTFIAIDHCIAILNRETNDMESTCDGMLTFENHIFLVELKKQRKGGWLSEAKGQLENTINLLSEHQSPVLDGIRYKKAFVCNRKHLNLKTIDNELAKKFFKETNGFRLDIQAEIVI